MDLLPGTANSNCDDALPSTRAKTRVCVTHTSRIMLTGKKAKKPLTVLHDFPSGPVFRSLGVRIINRPTDTVSDKP